MIRLRVGCVAALLLSVLATAIWPQDRASAADLRDLPVQFEGREMPFETAGSLILYRFSGRRTRDGLSGSEYLADALLFPFESADRDVFLVNDPAVLSTIGFPDPDRGRYSYLDLYPYLDALLFLADSLGSVERELDSTEREIRSLANNIRLFEGLASTLDVLRGAADSAFAAYSSGGVLPEGATTELPGMLAVIPVIESDGVVWMSPARFMAMSVERSIPAAALSGADEILGGWFDLMQASNDSGPQRRPTSDRAAILSETTRALGFPARLRTSITAELIWNRARLTFWASAVGIASIIGLWVLPRTRFRRLRFAVLRGGSVAILSLLTAHQVLRLVVTRRPPVTDLPSSFLFVAWLLSLAGVILSRRDRDARATSSITATFGTLGLLYLARLVTAGADPFGIVQAVLDTNFWLTTHVLIVTAGYAGVVAAGVAGHIFLIRRISQPYARSHHESVIRRIMVFSVIGLALTFLGTILGGVWADQAWGRFWGWDPKENGALLIILWSSIALHARLTRWIGQDGFAAASVIGVPVVLFSWLGVNLMGVGLHSYGFTSSSFWALIVVSALEIGFAGVALRMATRRRQHGGLHRVRVLSVATDGDARVLTLQSPNGAYRGGRYVGVRPDGFPHARPFSVIPGGPGELRLLVKDSGPVSGHLSTRVRPGHSLYVSSAAGDFALESPQGRTVILAAGGVGVAPLLGIAREALSEDRRVILIRASRDHLYASEHVAELERLGLVPLDILSRPSESWDGAHGHIGQEAIARATSAGPKLRVTADDLRRADWYIAGSPDFCSSASAAASRYGALQVFVEEFTPSIDPPPAPAFRAWITVDQKRVEVLPGQTILEAADNAGVEIPSSCRTGTCGECACTVTAGVSEQGVRPGHAQAGDIVHACVAFPADVDGLTVDIGTAQGTAVD